MTLVTLVTLFYVSLRVLEKKVLEYIFIRTLKGKENSVTSVTATFAAAITFIF